jgi:SAM-dependent methyltransferase
LNAKSALLLVPRAAMALAWDVTNVGVELALLGHRSWWWRLRWQGLRLYGPGGAYPVWLSDGRKQTRSWGQLSFGETPLACFLHMLRQIHAGPADRVLDLGCGRAWHLMAAAQELGVTCRGVDLIEGFIARGRTLAADLHLDHLIELQTGDIETADLSGATIVYVVSTAFEPALLDVLACRLAELPSGTRLITLDWILPEPAFHPLGGRSYPVSWGWAAVNFFEVRQ